MNYILNLYSFKGYLILFKINLRLFIKVTFIFSLSSFSLKSNIFYEIYFPLNRN